MPWTERYLAATLRSIPEPKRADVERELRSSIADAVEERVAAGQDRHASRIQVEMHEYPGGRRFTFADPSGKATTPRS